MQTKIRTVLAIYDKHGDRQERDGAAAGKDSLPVDWLNDLWEWPCGVHWMERVASRLAEVLHDCKPQPAVRKNLPLLAMRKAVFGAIVLGHGFRRLLPPYG